MKAAKYVIKYLIGTKSYAIKYNGGSNTGLIGYSNAEWAENKDNRQSTTGFVFLLAKGVITWASRKQKTVALSSMEAEYMALCA